MTCLSEFPGHKSFYKVSYDRNTYSCYLADDLNVIFVDGNNAFLYPENKSYGLSETEMALLNDLGEGGYIELDSNSTVKTCFRTFKH